MVEELQLEKHVAFLGPVPFTQMPDLFRRCAIFCMPTLAEAFGLSLLQAMASGKPVVASAVGGIPYFVEDGKSGHLVPSCDVDALSNALIDLLRNPDKMVAMGKHNRSLIEERYSWKPIVEQIEALYEEVLQRAD
jgi:glycosyltransferase involved in cell wall biosynthesis